MPETAAENAQSTVIYSDNEPTAQRELF